MIEDDGDNEFNLFLDNKSILKYIQSSKSSSSNDVEDDGEEENEIEGNHEAKQSNPSKKLLNTCLPQNTSIAQGQTQKKQQETIKLFRQGVYNTMIATCIGEEGLDIGEVDLLICYEGVSSPIRLLQVYSVLLLDSIANWTNRKKEKWKGCGPLDRRSRG